MSCESAFLSADVFFHVPADSGTHLLYFNQSPYSAGWEGFTFSWYRQLFRDTRILSALQNSLTVAFCAVGISGAGYSNGSGAGALSLSR